MILTAEMGNRTFSVETDEAIDISIPLNFGGPQPNAYGVEAARSVACRAGEIVGDTREGGSCNFEQVTLIPHCSGTHTECVGHITNERISVNDCLRDPFLPSLLITVEPDVAETSDEGYPSGTDPQDQLITASSIRNAMLRQNAEPAETPAGLIVRTLPNDDGKLSRTYLDDIPPYFTTDAMEYIVELGVRHLLVDLPSIDRLFDQGNLSNHRIFWNVEAGSFELNMKSRRHSTVTELIFVPETVEDGEYLLNLQIAPFSADAAPSRPLLLRPAQ